MAYNWMPPPCPCAPRLARPLRLGAGGLRACAAALLAASCLGLAPTGALAADHALPPAVEQALQAAQLPPQALAAVVMPVAALGPKGARPAAVWQVQADKPMQPASTMKLLTSIVALDRLGPNHRGFTELLTAAPQQGDVLAGDVVLRGAADPELGLPQLWAMLAELRWQGIRELGGDIVIDRHLFRPARPDVGLPPFDEHPELGYNAVPDALQLAGNLMGLELASTSGAVQARPLPPLPGVQLDASALRLTDKACKDWSDDWLSPRVVAAEGDTLNIALQGGFPKGCTLRLNLQLIDRDALAERHLRLAWQSLGGVWRGRLREASGPLVAPVAPTLPPAQAVLQPTLNALAPGVAWGGTPGATPAGVRVLARHLARPWGEVLRTMNKQSDNPLTRLLFLELGLADMATDANTPTAELARRAVLAWLRDQRINTDGVVLDNGSGLSRSERLSPRQLAQALQAAYAGRWQAELMMSVPVVAVDGTMRNRLKASPAASWARMKTGTLRDVTALAGWVPDAQGRLWVVVAMVNHEQAAAARPVLDALVDWVARGGLATHKASGRH